MALYELISSYSVRAKLILVISEEDTRSDWRRTLSGGPRTRAAQVIPKMAPSQYAATNINIKSVAPLSPGS